MKYVLGKNAAECVAVAAYAAGSLELLPHPAYRTYGWKTGDVLDEKGAQRHWLRMAYDRYGHEQVADLGDPADYLNSIYLRNDPKVWWRLMREELINPAGKEARKEAKTKNRAMTESEDLSSDFDRFEKVMETVIETQQMLSPSSTSYHHNTYAFYGADNAQPAWNEVCWRLDGKSPVPMPDCALADEELKDNYKGKVTVRVGSHKFRFVIDGSRGAGDGTVPLSSGASPTPYCKQIFRHEGAAKGQPSYDHMNAYDNELSASVTLYTVARIAASENASEIEKLEKRIEENLRNYTERYPDSSLNKRPETES